MNAQPSRPSPYRDRTPEENLDLFRRMRAGEFADGEKTLRAKIDLASPNMNMRDPAIYRIKHVGHHRQGDKRASPIRCAAWSLKTTARCTTGSSRTCSAASSPNSASSPA